MMGPYTAAKSGVEALTDALRMETAPSGARVGCAYFGFIDTDLVRASFKQPSAEAMTGRMPGFMRNPAPLSKAIDAIERGIEGAPTACGRRGGSARCSCSADCSNRSPNARCSGNPSACGQAFKPPPTHTRPTLKTRCWASRCRPSSSRGAKSRGTGTVPASHSTLENSAMAIASIASPMIATIAASSKPGTRQPNQVTPGASALRTAGEMSRWANTALRIGSTA